MKESDRKKKLKNQIFSLEAQHGQNSSSKKHFQMGESVGNKHKAFDLQQLKAIQIQIILFSSGNPEEWAIEFVQNSIKDKDIQRYKLKKSNNIR